MKKKNDTQKTNIINKENCQNHTFKSYDSSSAIVEDVSTQERHAFPNTSTSGFKTSRKKNPLRLSSRRIGIDGTARTPSHDLLRCNASSRAKIATEEQIEQTLAPLKTNLDYAFTLNSSTHLSGSELDENSIDEALADLQTCVGDISSFSGEGDSNDSSFDSGLVNTLDQAAGEAKYFNSLEHNMICRMQNPVAEILLHVEKNSSRALYTPNASPIDSCPTSPRLKKDEFSSLILFNELQSSISDYESYVTVPTRNQLREMSDSLSDVMNVSEIASLKRPIPIAYDTKPSPVFSIKNMYLSTPASININRKPHAC